MPKHRLSHISDSEFIAAVESATSYNDLVRRLGYRNGIGAVDVMQRRMAKLGLNHDHFQSIGRIKSKIPEYERRKTAKDKTVVDLTDKEFAEILPQVKSFGDFSFAAGLGRINGHKASLIRRRAALLGLNLDHFTFTSRSNGKSPRVKEESIFVANSRWGNVPSARIVRRLLEHGLRENVCAKCRTGSAWEGEPLGMMLHVLNDDRSDLRLENVVLLCPNCWSQASKRGQAQRGKKGGTQKRENLRLKKYKKLLNE